MPALVLDWIDFCFRPLESIPPFIPPSLRMLPSPTPGALDLAASLFPPAAWLLYLLKTLDTTGRRNVSNALFFCALYSTWCFGLYFSPPLDHGLMDNGVVQSGSVRRRNN